MNNCYIYRHIRLDKNEPFYIGIGTKMDDFYGYSEEYKRALCNTRRSIFWNNIVNKTEYRVDIILDNLTWKEACEKEIELIKLYGRKDLGLGILVNLTDGGDGQTKRVWSKELRERQSKTHKGLNTWTKGIKRSKETIEKARVSQKKTAARLRGKKVINIITSEVYDSITDASHLNNIKRGMLIKMLHNKKFNETNLRFL